MSSPPSTPLLTVEGLNAYYGTAQALEDGSFEILPGATSIVGRNGMGKTTLCNAILAIPPARTTGSLPVSGAEAVPRPAGSHARLDPLRGAGARRPPVLRDREPRHRLRAAGPQALPVPLRGRAPPYDRGARLRPALDRCRRLRALPAPRPAEAQRRRAAVG